MGEMEVDNRCYTYIDGTILSIHVKNFFCHDNFRVEFKEKTTFITGRNGSGKSAVLSALVVGLGGKALDTSRGKNVQSFVKKGANSATIAIKINNSSPRAYKHNEYGNSIIIEKTISSNGNSSYKIKSDRGEVISQTAAEVKAIVTAHNIQVDNPISILNQEIARDFSKSFDKKQLYSFFMRATNLDIIEDNYEKTLLICEKADQMWKRKNRYCNELKDIYEKWQKRYKQMQSRKEIQKELNVLKNELFWSQITEAEARAEVKRQQCDEQQTECDKALQRLERTAQALADGDFETLKEKEKELKAERGKIEQSLQKLQLDKRQAERKLEAAAHRVVVHKERLSRRKEDVRNYESRIQNIQSGGEAKKCAAAEERVRVLASRVAEGSARVATVRNDVTQATAHEERARTELDEAQRSGTAHLQNRLSKLRGTLAELDKRADPLAGYGANILKLNRRLQAEGHRFSKMPRGPIGQYLKAKDPNWAGPLEHVIGNAIKGYCVNSREDSRKLIAIMNQVWSGSEPKPSVTCGEFASAAYHLDNGSVRAPPFCSALEALQVNDVIAANYLVDNLRLETVLFVPGHEEAKMLATDVENVPRNCSRIVTQDCTEYYPAPRYRYYGAAARKPFYLQSSTTERKTQLQKEIQELEMNLQSYANHVQQLQVNLQDAQSKKAEASRMHRALSKKLCDDESDKRAACDELELLQAQPLTVLTEELNSLNQTIEQLSEELIDLTREENDCKCEVDKYTAAFKEGSAKLKLVIETNNKVYKELDEREIMMERRESERSDLERVLSEEQVKLQKIKAALAQQQAAIDEKIKEAPVPRIPNPRKSDVILKIIPEYRAKMNLMADNTLSRDEVVKNRDEAAERYNRMKSHLEKIRELIRRIEETAGAHLKFCCKLKVNIGRQVGFHFMATLITRAFYGKIEFDHVEGTLELVVSAREATRSAASTASLSGGERSYTTVAFITALWSCVELPFYFMDEFDVFMDDINRQFSVGVLLESGSKLYGRQFVFLSPNSVPTLPNSNEMSMEIIALEDPVR